MKPIRTWRASLALASSLSFTVGPTIGADYTQDFTAPDGTTDLGDGSFIKGNFVYTPEVQGNQLQFTTNTNNNNSAFHIPALAGSSNGWTATFDFTISDTTASHPAEGFSFSYGDIPALNSSRGEEGWPGRTNVLSFEIDIAVNGDGEVGPAIGLNRPSNISSVGGSTHSSSLAFTNGDILPDDGTVSGTATVSWVPGVGASFTTTGLITNADFSFIPTPGFTGSDAFKFAFAGRTTGSNAAILIDNVNISIGTSDTDGDGLPDAWETAYGLDPNSDAGEDGAGGDPDGDTLTNLEEFNGGTLPNNTDSDGDTLADNHETLTGVWVSSTDTGTDPTEVDSDGDGLADNVETCTGAYAGALDTGTDPNIVNTDGDNLDDGEEVAKGTRDPNVSDDPDPDSIYEQNFDGFPDNTTSLGDGSVLAGTAVVINGALRMTTNTGNNSAAFHIPPRVDSSKGFNIRFDYTINTTGNPADGFAVSYGDLPFGGLSTTGEEGFPGVFPCLSFEMDTYENGGPEIGPGIAVDDVTVVSTVGAILNNASTISGTITIEVKADGTASFKSTGAVTNADFQGVDTGFTLLDSHSFAFTARTGGAWEELTIDNIEIYTGVPDNDGDGLSNAWEIANGLNPNSADGDDGATGDPDGDGSTNAQEFTRGTNPKSDDTDGDGLLDGVEDGGGLWVNATQTGTSPTNPDSDGDQLLDGVEDNGGVYVSETQTGTDPNNINSDGDSAQDGAELLVGRDPTVPDDPAPSTKYEQNFDVYPDGYTNLADGSTIGSTNGTSAAVIGQQLRLTEEGVGGTRSSFRIPALRGSSEGFTATFDFTITDSPLSNNPADGFNFSYGAIPPLTANDASPNGHGAAEEAWPGVDHISFEIDTWNIGDAELGVNIASEIGGVPTNHAFTNGTILDDGTSVSGTATISWNPSDGASFVTTGLVTNADFQNVPIPGFVGSDDYIFAFGARTGGAYEDLFIDNIVITTGGRPLQFDLTSDGDNLLLIWDSNAGRVYDVVSSTTLDTPISSWPPYEPDPVGAPGVLLEDIPSTAPENMTTFARPGEDVRFFAIVEKEAPALYAEDFESGPGGWTAGANPDDTGTTMWEHGAPDPLGSDFGFPPNTGADGSMFCFGTNIDSDYGPNTDIYLRSPSIDLTGPEFVGATLTLTLQHFLDVDSFGPVDGDLGFIRVLNAADNTPIGADLASALEGVPLDADDWKTFTADLPAGAVGNMIRIEFQFTSNDNGFEYAGWYIDNVEVKIK